jgi:hypothetical protein
MESESYICSRCGEKHFGPPLSYGVAVPYSYEQLSWISKRLRATLTSETCTIGRKHFFIAGNIVCPIIGKPITFSWTVWVSLSDQNFKRSLNLWNTVGRESEPPYFGWLNTLLPGYPSTLNLKTWVHTQMVGIRPLIELEETDHPISIEQRVGMSWERVNEIAEKLHHPTPV